MIGRRRRGCSALSRGQVNLPGAWWKPSGEPADAQRRSVVSGSWSSPVVISERVDAPGPRGGRPGPSFASCRRSRLRVAQGGLESKPTCAAARPPPLRSFPRDPMAMPGVRCDDRRHECARSAGQESSPRRWHGRCRLTSRRPGDVREAGVGRRVRIADDRHTGWKSPLRACLKAASVCEPAFGSGREGSARTGRDGTGPRTPCGNGPSYPLRAGLAGAGGQGNLTVAAETAARVAACRHDRRQAPAAPPHDAKVKDATRPTRPQGRTALSQGIQQGPVHGAGVRLSSAA